MSYLDIGRFVGVSCLDVTAAAHQIGETALLLAVDEGLIKHVRLLLDRHADAHDRDANGRTLLEVASESGFTDVAAELIARAPDLIGVAGVRGLSLSLRLAACLCILAIVGLTGRDAMCVCLRASCFSSSMIVCCKRQERALDAAIRSDFADTVTLLLPRVTELLVADDDSRLSVRIARVCASSTVMNDRSSMSCCEHSVCGSVGVLCACVESSFAERWKLSGVRWRVPHRRHSRSLALSLSMADTAAVSL